MSKQSATLKLAERDLMRQVSDFLEYRGWRRLRMQSGKFANAGGNVFQVGEVGMADCLFIRYFSDAEKDPDKSGLHLGLSATLWVEFKAPGARDQCSCQVGGKKCRLCFQYEWRQREHARGAAVIKCSSFEAFQVWYQERFGWINDIVTKGQRMLVFES